MIPSTKPSYASYRFPPELISQTSSITVAFCLMSGPLTWLRDREAVRFGHIGVVIGGSDRNHRSAVPTLIATRLRARTHNHCNWAHKGCHWDRNHRRRAHTDCTGARVGVGNKRTASEPVRSYGQACGKHLVLQLAASVSMESQPARHNSVSSRPPGLLPLVRWGKASEKVPFPALTSEPCGLTQPDLDPSLGLRIPAPTA